MFRPVLITPPAELPVTLTEAKAFAAIDHADDDNVLDALLRAAVDHLDGFRGLLGRCMVTQTWQVSRPCWTRRLLLPVPDVVSVTVQYDDEGGAEQTVPAASVTFHATTAGTLVIISDDFALPTLESGNAAPVRVAFTAGFGGAADIPPPLKVAIMQIAARIYDGRGGDADIANDPVISSLIGPYRWRRV